MGLSIAGKKDEAEQAFLWLSDNQLEDGSWYSEYLKSIPQTKRRETNFSAYIATVTHGSSLTHLHPFPSTINSDHLESIIEMPLS